MSTETTTKPMLWAGRVISGLLVLFMLFDCSIKLADLAIVKASMVELDWPVSYDRLIGAIELVCVVLYLVPRTAVLGAVLMMGVFGGAIASHLRHGDPLFSHVLFGVYLGLLAWGGLWLRDARLRALFPVRR